MLFRQSSKSFQPVRRQGMMLAIGFHTDPNYAKSLSAYICKDMQKASTVQFYKYLTVIWINAPEPITLGVQLIPSEHSVFETVQNLLIPLITREKVIGVLGDGDFYNWDIIKWLNDIQIFFVIQGRVNSGVKPLVQKHHKMLNQKGSSIVLDYRMNKGHTRKRIPVKLVLYQLGRRVMALIVPPDCYLTGKQIHELYRKRLPLKPIIDRCIDFKSLVVLSIRLFDLFLFSSLSGFVIFGSTLKHPLNS